MLEAISGEFPFEPHHLEVRDSRMHYLDVGQGEVVSFSRKRAAYEHFDAKRHVGKVVIADREG